MFYFSGIILLVSSRKLFQLGAWATYHKKLDKHFSQFPYEKVPQKEQLWKDRENNIVFIFLLGRLTNGAKFYPLFA
jgi:hypothetical protein